MKKANHTYTFSGWLKFVKGIHDVSSFFTGEEEEKWNKLQEEYNEYLLAEDERLAELELEEKAIKRKKRDRRTNKGTFHGKSRGKYVGKNY